MFKMKFSYNINKYFVRLIHKINNAQTPKINCHHLQFKAECFDIKL